MHTRNHFSFITTIVSGLLVWGMFSSFLPVGSKPVYKPSSLETGFVGTITHAGFRPRALALDETRNRLFVYDGSNNTIYFYDATTLEELGSLTTTLQGCDSMVVDESRGKLYAGSASASGADPKDNIAVIDTASGTLIKYLATMGENLLVKDEARDVVYVSSVGGAWKIDVATDAMTPIEGPYGNVYTSMGVNPVTHELFIANWSQNDGYLFIVDPDTLEITSIPDMNGFGVTVNWIENKVYVSYCQSAGLEAVCIYDRDTGTVNRLHTTNDSTEPLVFNPDVNRLYSDTEVNAISTVLDGASDDYVNRPMTQALVSVGVRFSTDNVYYVDADGTYVVRGATGEVLAEYPAAGASCSVCISEILIDQDAGLVYVVNQTTDETVTVIQDGELSAPTCNVTPYPAQGSASGALTTDDCRSPIRQENYFEPFYADRYSFNGNTGQQIRIVLSSSFTWRYLYLVDPSGNVIAESWSGCFEGACIPDTAPNAWFTLPTTGVYTIEVTTLYEDITGSYTLTLSRADPIPTSVTIKSVGALDGWVLESTETSGKGGTFNSTATIFYLGDNAQKKQYRSILSFSTKGLPDNADISRVTLKLGMQGVAGGGDPVRIFQGFMVDLKKGYFGSALALQAGDFQAGADKSFGPFKPTSFNGWYLINLTPAKYLINKRATNGGVTQLRLRFKLDDNNNAVANFMKVYSGNGPATFRPQLIIEYYVP